MFHQGRKEGFECSCATRAVIESYVGTSCAAIKPGQNSRDVEGTGEAKRWDVRREKTENRDRSPDSSSASGQGYLMTSNNAALLRSTPQNEVVTRDANYLLQHDQLTCGKYVKKSRKKERDVLHT